MSALVHESVVAGDPATSEGAERVLLDGSRLAYVGGRGLVAGCRERDGVLCDAAGDAVPQGEVVALPSPGERVEVPGGPALWLGVKAAPLAGHLAAKVMLDSGEVRALPGTVERFDAARIMTGPGSAEVSRLAAALYVSAINLEVREQEHQVWIQNLTEAAHDRANDQGWCEEFDDWMASQGLDRRRRDYEVEVSVRASVTVVMSSMSSADDARESIGLTDVWQALSRDDIDWDIEGVESV